MAVLLFDIFAQNKKEKEVKILEILFNSLETASR